jgi:hypothetical protein
MTQDPKRRIIQDTQIIKRKSICRDTKNSKRQKTVCQDELSKKQKDSTCFHFKSKSASLRDKKKKNLVSALKAYAELGIDKINIESRTVNKIHNSIFPKWKHKILLYEDKAETKEEGNQSDAFDETESKLLKIITKMSFLEIGMFLAFVGRDFYTKIRAISIFKIDFPVRKETMKKIYLFEKMKEIAKSTNTNLGRELSLYLKEHKDVDQLTEKTEIKRHKELLKKYYQDVYNCLCFILKLGRIPLTLSKNSTPSHSNTLFITKTKVKVVVLASALTNQNQLNLEGMIGLK